MTGNLVTARAILDAVVAGRIDVGPLDGYWHMLIARHRPELVAELRVVASTDCAPMPPLVASPALGAERIARLKAALAAAHLRPWFASLAADLLIERFAPMAQEDFALTLAWDRQAKADGYATIV